jgi:hypothetical protein
MTPTRIIPTTAPTATFVDVDIDEIVVVALLYQRIFTISNIKRKKVNRTQPIQP